MIVSTIKRTLVLEREETFRNTNLPVEAFFTPAWSPTVLNVPEGDLVLSTVACHQNGMVYPKLRAHEVQWFRNAT